MVLVETKTLINASTTVAFQWPYVGSTPESFCRQLITLSSGIDDDNDYFNDDFEVDYI